MTESSDPTPLSNTDLDTLSAVLDCLVPPSEDGQLPGAGALGIGAYVAERFGESAPALAAGLVALDARAVDTHGGRFLELASAQRVEVLEAHAAADPGFLPGLLFHTYAGYYQVPEVLEAHGMEGRPPHPKGYEIGPHDPTLLDPVRARGPLYRDV